MSEGPSNAVRMSGAMLKALAEAASGAHLVTVAESHLPGVLDVLAHHDDQRDPWDEHFLLDQYGGRIKVTP